MDRYTVICTMYEHSSFLKHNPCSGAAFNATEEEKGRTNTMTFTRSLLQKHTNMIEIDRSEEN
jgi:hypothetical protein